MAGVTCYRCASSLSVAEAIEQWCEKCRREPLLMKPAAKPVAQPEKQVAR